MSNLYELSFSKSTKCNSRELGHFVFKGTWMELGGGGNDQMIIVAASITALNYESSHLRVKTNIIYCDNNVLGGDFSH